MKKLLLLSFLIILSACTHPDFNKDGGTRIVLEASVGDLLRQYIRPGDSIAYATIHETYKEYSQQEGSFLDLYFAKLAKADPSSTTKHFKAEGLSESASSSDCKSFFEKKLSETMDNISMIIAKRMNAFGVREPGIRKDERAERLIVELTGMNDKQRIRKLLQASAKLEFLETYENAEVADKLNRLNTVLAEELHLGITDTVEKVKEAEPAVKKGGTLDEQLGTQEGVSENQEEKMERLKQANPLFSVLMPSYKFDTDGNPTAYGEGPKVGTAYAKDTAQVNKLLGMAMCKKIVGPYTRFLWTFKSINQKNMYELIAIRTSNGGVSRIAGNVVEDARLLFDDQSGGAPQISMTMTKEAGWDWEKMTRDNIGKSIAIAVDDQVYSYPRVMSEISGGMSSITGDFTREEAEDFANVLKAGYLPVPLRIIQEDVVAPKK
ncbi:MAG TPA: hypothetical protein VGC65_06035 [Bacteroidia bacterium]|jgi:SecD/SecF fusion protein